MKQKLSFKAYFYIKSNSLPYYGKAKMFEVRLEKGNFYCKPTASKVHI